MGPATENNAPNLYFLQVKKFLRRKLETYLQFVFLSSRFHSTVVLVDCWKNSYRPGVGFLNFKIDTVMNKQYLSQIDKADGERSL